MRRTRRRVPTIILLIASFGAVAAGGLAAAHAGASVIGRENPADRSTYDPYFAEQWALQALRAPDAWPRSTGSGVKVGVVDTGVDLAHEDLVGKVVASTGCLGADDVAAACTGGAQDDQGHGTHVAGIIAADTLNGRGVASVAPGAVLVVAKALGAGGSGNLEDVNAAIKWVVDRGAQIVNLSLEADGGQVSGAAGQSLTEGVDYAWRHGAIPVIAAGNATPSLFGPGGYAGVDAVIVGATGRSGSLAWYSSPLSGATWGVVAPGGDARGPDGTASCAGALAAGCIVSTGWFAGHADAYADDEGTSMAAPEVAGVLALLLGEGLTPKAAVARLVATARPLACGPGCAGAVDAAAAVGTSLPTTYGSAGLHPASTVPPPPPEPRVGSGSAPVVASAPPPLPTTLLPTTLLTTEHPSGRRPGPAPVVRLAAGRVTAPPRRRQDALAIVVAVALLVAVSAEAAAVAVLRRQV